MRRVIRESKVVDGVGIVFLSNGMETWVDAEDLELVSSFTWYVSSYKNKCYAITHAVKQGKKVKVRLHRLILGITDPTIEVDHRNGNSLDNRKENLRPCSGAMNKKNIRKGKRNTSGYIGVRKHGSGWRSSITHEGVVLNLGTFPTAKKAADVRDSKAMELRGEFAVLNGE